MEQKSKMHMYRHLNIQHQKDAHYRQQHHLYTLKLYKYREQQFERHINRLRKNLEHIRPYTSDEDEDACHTRDISLIPNGFIRIRNHSHLLHFSSQTQKRLLCQAPSYKTVFKQQTPILPSILKSKSVSSDIDQCEKRLAFYQSRLPILYSCRTPVDLLPFSSSKMVLDKIHQQHQEQFSTYIEQCQHDEHMKQRKNFERKECLLKEFDQLKYTINDPHSTLSALAALTRALAYINL